MMRGDGRRQDEDVFVAGDIKERVNQIGFGGWQLGSMIASPAEIWPYESL
jgi:hypothetical protein